VARAPQPCQEIPVEQMSGGVLARMRPDLGIGAALPPAGRQRPGSGSPGAWHTGGPGDNAGMARDDSMAHLRWAALRLLDGGRPARTSGWVPFIAPSLPRRRRGRALGRRAPAAGPGRVGRRCWLRAGGVGPWHGSADRGRGARELPAAIGPDAQAWHTGPGCRRDGNTRSPSAIAVLPRARPCFPGSVDGHRRALAPAPPAAADGARDRRRSPERRV
jgi:hypothetical protein